MVNEFNTCPDCEGRNLEREEVDIGVGVMYGPPHCLDCGWSEHREELGFIDGNDDDELF